MRQLWGRRAGGKVAVGGGRQVGGNDFILMQQQTEHDLILAKFQQKWGVRAGGEERTLLLFQAAKSSRGA